MTRGPVLLTLVLVGACKAPPPPAAVTASSAQGAETAYTSIRPLSDSARPVPPPVAVAPESWAGEDFSNLGIYATGPVELVLIDPSGRRTGHAGDGAPELREIPRSSTDCDYLSDDSDSGGGDTPHVLELMASQPDSGRYVLEAYGTGAGAYDIRITLTSGGGRTVDIPALDGAATSGMVRRFAFTFLKSSSSAATVDTLTGPDPR